MSEPRERPQADKADNANDRLAAAFQALADRDGTEEVPEVLRERIWLAVSGALPPAERRLLVERTITDPGGAEAWRIASEMWRATQGSAIEPGLPAPRPLTRWTPRWLALAAVLLLGTTIGVISILNRTPGDEFRAASGFVIKSLVPADRLLPRDAFTLRWTPGPEGSRYQVRVTTEDLRPIATAADLSTAEFTVTRAALRELQAGANLLWQVDLSLPNGERLTSPTFTARVD